MRRATFTRLASGARRPHRQPTALIILSGARLALLGPHRPRRSIMVSATTVLTGSANPVSSTNGMPKRAICLRLNGNAHVPCCAAGRSSSPVTQPPGNFSSRLSSHSAGSSDATRGTPRRSPTSLHPRAMIRAGSTLFATTSCCGRRTDQSSTGPGSAISSSRPTASCSAPCGTRTSS